MYIHRFFSMNVYPSLSDQRELCMNENVTFVFFFFYIPHLFSEVT
jgi:hypothetical protein